MIEQIQCGRKNETVARNDSPINAFLNFVKRLKINP